MTHNNHFISTLLLLTLLTITTADQNTTSTQSDDITHTNLPDQCRESEIIDCSKCPCPQLSSQFSASMLAIAGLSSALCFIFLIFMVLVKEIREKPGDLVLGTIFAQIIFSVIFMIEKLAFPNPHTQMLNLTEANSACTGLGVVKASSGALLNFYLLSFFAVYVLSIKNYLKISRIKSKYIHIAGIMLTGLFCGILLSWRAIGLNPDGTCGMTGAPAILAPTVGYGVLAVFGIYLVYLARKNLAAARESLNETQADFVKHYSFYLKIMCLLFLAGVIIALTSNIKTSPEETNDHPLIQIFGFIQFVIINICTIVLIVARIRDPMIYMHVKDYLRSLCCANQTSSYEEKDKRKNSDEEDLLGTINDDTKIDISSGFTSNSSLIQANYSLFQVHEDSCERVKKIEMLSSVLATLAYYWKQSHQDMIKKEMNERSPRSPRRKDFGSKKIAVTNSMVRKLVPQVGREIVRRNNKLLYGIFSAALPELFQEVIERDDLLLELKDAWNFIPNYGNILSYGYHVDEFGKMWFLSSNGKYILQEITSQEKRNLVQALPAYYDHLKINPDSLLARIYGLFTFEAEDYANEIHMIVVKNVGECGWPGVERVYKIGSLVNNETNKHAKKGGYVPLNEKDFEAYEGKLALEEPLKTNIKDILAKDVEFLQDNHMENYALQVSLVNKEKVSKEMVSSSVIIEVEESDPGSDLIRGSRGSHTRDYLEGIDIEGLNDGDETVTENTIKTYVGVVDFWRETTGRRPSLVWKTLRSLRPRSVTTVGPLRPRSETTVVRLSKYAETFLKYVDSIVV